MRLVTVLLVSAGVLTILSIPLGPLPPLGGLLDFRGGFWTVADQAAPIEYQRLDFPGLQAPVDVFRDADGIPHVFAAHDDDLYRALGYLHASDRLFQMDVQRRAALGTLAEILGEGSVEMDVFIRTLGIPWAAERSLAAADAETRALLDAYAAGVNQYRGEVTPLDLPLEFKVLNYEPRPWEPLDSAAFGKLLAWGLSGSFADLELQRVQDALGGAALAELFPLDIPFPLPIIPEEGQPAPRHESLASGRRNISFPAEPVENLLRAFAHTSALLGSPTATGSNNWVVSGNLATGGGPLLANDPHLALSLPSLWYLERLHSPSLDVFGVALVGAPLPVLGYNAHIAWGFTNVGADVVDFFLEQARPGEPGQYLYQNQWVPFTLRREAVQVRGAGEFTFDLRISRHGPIISDLPGMDGRTLAMQWTGHSATRELRAILRLNRAEDWATFREALEDFHVPAQNVVYADAEGHIGMVVNGLFPVRKAGLGRVPQDGASGMYDWSGTVPFSEVPSAFDPAQGYLVSANQLPSTSPTPYLGWDWADRYRAARVHEVLTPGGVTEATMKNLQGDHVSLAAREFLPFLLEALEALGDGGASLHPKVPAAASLLAGWNFDMDAEAVAPTIYRTWLSSYRTATFGDEWEASGLEAVRFPSFTVLENLTKREPTSPWFDDGGTAAAESRDDNLRRAFVEALETLESRIGGSMSDWQWGAYQALQLQHPSGLEALSSPMVPRDGGPFTLDVAAGILRDDRLLVTSGPSWRLIVNFSDLGPRGPRAYGVYPGGQSGNPLHPHYLNLFAIWREGEYVLLQLTELTDFPRPGAPGG